MPADLPLNPNGSPSADDQRSWQAALERERLLAQRQQFPGPGAADDELGGEDSPARGPSRSPARPSIKERAGEAAESAGRMTERAGKAVQYGGKGLEAGGKAVEAGGQAAEVGGKALAAGGKATRQGSQALMKAGAQMSSTGVGAIAGVPLAALGAVGTAGGAGAEVGGKGLEAGGKAAKSGGRAAQKAGQGVSKAGQGVSKAGSNLKNAGASLPQAPGLMRGSSDDGASMREGAQRFVGAAKIATGVGAGEELGKRALAAGSKATQKALAAAARGDLAGAPGAAVETFGGEFFRGVLFPLFVMASFISIPAFVVMNLYFLASLMKLKFAPPLSSLEIAAVAASNLYNAMKLGLISLLFITALCAVSPDCPLSLGGILGLGSIF